MFSVERIAVVGGTRMLIAEEAFDAMIELMVRSGAVTRSDAAKMLKNLSELLKEHAEGRTDTVWCVEPQELMEQAARLQSRSEAMQTAS